MKPSIMQSDVDNRAYVRQIYPEAGGMTVGTGASPLTPYVAGRSTGFGPKNTLVDSGRGTATPAPGGPAPTGTARPLTWWIVLALLLVGLMYFSQRFGSEKEEFKNLKLSAYNIIVITLAAMVGFGVFKTVFGKFQVAGLSDYVLSV
jgi:hypothetical protein